MNIIEILAYIIVYTTIILYVAIALTGLAEALVIWGFFYSVIKLTSNGNMTKEEYKILAYSLFLSIFGSIFWLPILVYRLIVRK